jgi:DNA-binding transcriptional ArsR family regulator
MIPKQYRGSRPSTCPAEILALMQNKDWSMQDIIDTLPSQLKPRTVRYHMELLRKAKMVEKFVKLEDMRRPLYRLVRK